MGLCVMFNQGAHLCPAASRIMHALFWVWGVGLRPTPIPMPLHSPDAPVRFACVSSRGRELEFWNLGVKILLPPTLTVKKKVPCSGLRSTLTDPPKRAGCQGESEIGRSVLIEI